MQRASWLPRRPRTLLTVGLLTVTVTVAAGVVVPGVTDRPARAARATQAGPVVRVDTVGRDPRAWLLLLAERLRAIAADGTGTAGPVGADSCLHVQRLAPTEHGILLVESLRWITPDGGGVVMQTQATVPARMGGSPASDPQFDDLASGWPAPVVTRYVPGALVSPVGDPVPAGAHLMANRIALRTAATLRADTQNRQDLRDALVVAVLADLAGIRFLGPSQRAAVLQVLAALPTLTTPDDDAGVTGRGAVALRVAAGPAAATVVVDAVSGQLLRYQTGTGADRFVLRFGASRCGCPQPEPGWSTLPRFWPPVLIQPADTAVSGRPAPQPHCPARNSQVLFVPVQATASTEAAR